MPERLIQRRSWFAGPLVHSQAWIAEQAAPPNSKSHRSQVAAQRLQPLQWAPAWMFAHRQTLAAPVQPEMSYLPADLTQSERYCRLVFQRSQLTILSMAPLLERTRESEGWPPAALALE